MSLPKPSIPKGTRDFNPVEMIRRNFIFETIRNVFQMFGYQPIETPAMENLSTLMGKYGEEGDKLLFKILNSGDFMHAVQNLNLKSQNSELKSQNYKDLTPYISEKGLRYDLTVPFARFVVQHQHELIFPFKRYQIQPVWRADRPQKGRYREFFQCDVDVVGSHSLLYEVELVQITDAIFSALGIKVLIRINNRKILAGIADAVGAADKLPDITIAMDKLDKIGLEKVNEELIQRGISREAVEKLQPIFQLEDMLKSNAGILSDFLRNSEIGCKGLEEIEKVNDFLKIIDLNNKFIFDIKLARGLNYYTGTIIEVNALDVAIGSMCGGGRYDDLTGIFGLPDMSGVGISFGADRIHDVMLELNLFPSTIVTSTRVLFINFGADEEKYCLNLASRVRAAGIPAEIYPEQVKIKKQMDYANRKNIPYVVLAGQDEIQSGYIAVKDMKSGEQHTMVIDELITLLQL
ncbi:MAG: histidine--tRNA ligase [Bacteroidales bacterium]|jgi:histidyl-tRNA synthetase|nr:histidine--tRNA ligase [Bacteroidales bacterium]